MKTLKLTALAAVIAASSLSAKAALYDRGNGLIYDSHLNITWLQDANYAQTSGYSADGLLIWNTSIDWAANLTYGGFTDWRLPSAVLNGTWDEISWDGSTDYSYNNTRSELGHLYHELGNKGYCNTSAACNQPNFGWLNTTFIDATTGQSVSFLNVQNHVYWAAEAYVPNPLNIWHFNAAYGLNYGYRNTYNPAYAWAVHDGDVAAVPVPAAAWLFGSSLLGLAGVARRRK